MEDDDVNVELLISAGIQNNFLIATNVLVDWNACKVIFIHNLVSIFIVVTTY